MHVVTHTHKQKLPDSKVELLLSFVCMRQIIYQRTHTHENREIDGKKHCRWLAFVTGHRVHFIL